MITLTVFRVMKLTFILVERGHRLSLFVRHASGKQHFILWFGLPQYIQISLIETQVSASIPYGLDTLFSSS